MGMQITPKGSQFSVMAADGVKRGHGGSGGLITVERRQNLNSAFIRDYYTTTPLQNASSQETIERRKLS
jgi:hypothetical protein